MTRLFFACLVCFASLLHTSCMRDECHSTQTYTIYTPIYMQMDEVRKRVKTESPKTIENPGKIHVYDKYLFINEKGRGIHVMDISQPSSPSSISFINIPGNLDMAINQNKLYTDNFTDLVTFDISNPHQINAIGRNEDIFPTNLTIEENTHYHSVDKTKGVAVEWEKEIIEMDCSEFTNWREGDFAEGGFFLNGNMTKFNDGGGSNGIGGSMGRFTFLSDYLYVLERNGDLQYFSTQNTAKAEWLGSLSLGNTVETLFPYYRDGIEYLFIGATNGMSIYNNSNQGSPERIGGLLHVQSCDPVVALDSLAFVTLRSGTTCNGVTDELQLVDIKNLDNPKLIAQYDLSNPHGLAYDGNLLFICDGSAGIKIYDLSESTEKIDQKLIFQEQGMMAYDAIAYHGTLIVSTDKGIYLIDYSDRSNIKIESLIESAHI